MLGSSERRLSDCQACYLGFQVPLPREEVAFVLKASVPVAIHAPPLLTSQRLRRSLFLVDFDRAGTHAEATAGDEVHG